MFRNEHTTGQESDKEFETLGVFGLNYSTTEFAKIRADAMRSKEETYNLIQTKGVVHADDVIIEPADSLAKNMMNAYLIGANLFSNLMINEDDYMLPITAKRKQEQIMQRQTNTI